MPHVNLTILCVILLGAAGLCQIIAACGVYRGTQSIRRVRKYENQKASESGAKAYRHHPKRLDALFDALDQMWVFWVSATGIVLGFVGSVVGIIGQ